MLRGPRYTWYRFVYYLEPGVHPNSIVLASPAPCDTAKISNINEMQQTNETQKVQDSWSIRTIIASFTNAVAVITVPNGSIHHHRVTSYYTAHTFPKPLLLVSNREWSIQNPLTVSLLLAGFTREYTVLQLKYTSRTSSQFGRLAILLYCTRTMYRYGGGTVLA